MTYLLVYEKLLAIFFVNLSTLKKKRLKNQGLRDFTGGQKVDKIAKFALIFVHRLSTLRLYVLICLTLSHEDPAGFPCLFGLADAYLIQAPDRFLEQLR